MAEDLKSKKDQQKKKTTKKDPKTSIAGPSRESVPGTSRDVQQDDDLFGDFNDLDEPPKQVGYRPDSPIVLSD
jgi:hypothetical protein